MFMHRLIVVTLLNFDRLEIVSWYRTQAKSDPLKFDFMWIEISFCSCIACNFMRQTVELAVEFSS